MAKLPRTRLTKADMENLPKVNGDPKKEAARLYTELIFTGHSKKEAFAEAFPEHIKELQATKGDKVLSAEIAKAINRLESNKFTQECFNAANKNWWMKFMGKKQDIYEKLYATAMDDNERTSDRLNASKIFLAHIPDAPKDEVNVNIEVKVGSEEFKQMLQSKKRLLYGAANDEVIDVETEESSDE